MTAYERRYSILIILCRRRRETRENLANEFGVSKRTIEYDILYLSLKYPIYTKQGNGGGIYIMAGFKLNKPSMNEKQIGLLNKLATMLTGEDKEIIIEIVNIYSG